MSALSSRIRKINIMKCLNYPLNNSIFLSWINDKDFLLKYEKEYMADFQPSTVLLALKSAGILGRSTKNI